MRLCGPPPGRSRGLDDASLGLLAGVDCAALAAVLRLPGFPLRGWMSFHGGCMPGPPAGGGDGWCVRWDRDGAGDSLMGAAESGQGLSVLDCGVTPVLSPPSPTEPAVQALERRFVGLLGVYEAVYEAWRCHLSPDGEPEHRLGGWPSLVGDDGGFIRSPVSGLGFAGSVLAASESAGCAVAQVGLDQPGFGASTRALVQSASDGSEPAASVQVEPVAGRAASAGSALVRSALARPVPDRSLLLQLDSDPRIDRYWGEPGRVFFHRGVGEPIKETAAMTQSAYAHRARPDTASRRDEQCAA